MTSENELKKHIIDKYCIKSSVVKQCITLIKKHIYISKTDLIIVPSAGDGSFIKSIKKLSSNYKFYDLEPEHEEIIKQDFLNMDYMLLKYQDVHIIGKPPFGKQASTAIKFIKRCCLFSNSISFILPKNFKNSSMKNHFNKHYHLVCEIDLSENSFSVNNLKSNILCVFQIWKYKEEKRIETKKELPVNFKFVTKDNNPDISFCKVGVNAGSVMKEIDCKSIQTHYFIKFTNNKTIDENIEKVKSINFNNIDGSKSISRVNVINEFNKLLV